ncbi:MAG: IS256 family transposase [Candidatus Limnocylindrales bacterium]
MALPQSALSELLEAIRAGGDTDVLRDAMRLVLQELIELEASQAIGAGRYERTDERTTHRNGSRSRLLSTKAGDVELRIPKFRAGSFLPALLEPRRRIDRALWAVVMEAYIHGVSTRKVDDLVVALGIDAGISKSEVSRICTELDGLMAAFRGRRLDHVRFPYVFLDATYVKAHVGPSVVSQAIVIATGVTETGDREVLGLDVGDSEDGAFWTEFLRSLRRRGLAGVRLVISDAHEGLKGAITAVFTGAAWQRCRVHFLRNVLARIPKAQAQMVLAAIRTIWAQPDALMVGEQLDEIADKLERRFPVVARMLTEAKADLTAFAAFPFSHWPKIWSTNPLERVNKEIKRRTDVVGIFPNETAVVRLAGAVLLEIHEEWAISDRRYLSEVSMARLDRATDDGLAKEVGRATTALLAS